MKIGLYAGSFDPVTRGHLSVIQQAFNVVDKLHVVVSTNPGKKGLFSMNERIILIEEALNEEFGTAILQEGRVELSLLIETLTVEYAKRVGATLLIRGIRNGADYAYERSIAVLNKKLAPQINTIFVPTPVEYEEVSSSTVKGLMRFPGGEVAAKEFVPQNVLEQLRLKFTF